MSCSLLLLQGRVKLRLSVLESTELVLEKVLNCTLFLEVNRWF